MSDRPSVLRFVHPLPYGAIVHDGGVQFVVFSRRATAMRVLLYDTAADPEPAEIVDFDPDLNRWGDIWSVFVPGVGPEQLYHFQADGPFEPDKGLRFDGRARLIDPYAKALAGDFLPAADGIVRPPKCVVVDDEFDWQGDRHLRRGLHETVIYEMHVRGFTCDRSSGVSHPGTYLGLIEKIPYLQSLGVTAVELMPVFEFPTNDCLGQHLKRPTYWGYDPLAFFAPHRGYAVGGEPGCQVREFKEMVLALHRAGIEVILDVVFNHTAEGNEDGPTLSFKGLENRVYYMLENGGRSLSQLLRLRQHPQRQPSDRPRDDLPLPPLLGPQLSRRRLPLRSGVDPQPQPQRRTGAQSAGARVDRRRPAAGRHEDHRRGLGRRRGLSGGHVRQPPLGGMERPLPRRSAPLLAGRSEHGRPAGHAVGRIERPLRGQRPAALPQHQLHHFPRRLHARTIWFLTARSTTRPTARRTATARRNNFSYNYGAEGPTRRAAIETVRLRQIKNLMASLLLSQGVPMLLSGDECRRTQGGNNNAYCQDNEISWFDWRLVERHAGLRRFWRRWRPSAGPSPRCGRRISSAAGPCARSGLPDVSWFGPSGGERRMVWRLAQPGVPAGGRSAGGSRSRRRTITC